MANFDVRTPENFFSEMMLKSSSLEDARAKFEAAEGDFNANKLSKDAFEEAKNKHNEDLILFKECEVALKASHDVLFYAASAEYEAEKARKIAEHKTEFDKIIADSEAKTAAGLSTKVARDKAAAEAKDAYVRIRSLARERLAESKTKIFATYNASLTAAVAAKEAAYCAANERVSIDTSFNCASAREFADKECESACDAALVKRRSDDCWSENLYRATIKVPYDKYIATRDAANDGPDYKKIDKLHIIMPVKDLHLEDFC
jgi:hypothetical protein